MRPSYGEAWTTGPIAKSAAREVIAAISRRRAFWLRMWLVCRPTSTEQAAATIRRFP